ncbi:HAD family hydrolase [Lewinella sp. IMCC34191]|uniref:HAD family hydrolase n=1 Tax=Lewinella sp. IMCC34191 TaxID=2259172 RepID=UPI000E249F62|nr:HAD family hydrolase [Lewinella sp. IMCC34191]
MIVSFDIDNTLIPYGDEFPVEGRSPWTRLLGGEAIRRGTVSLFRALEDRGHEVWLYTTSFRSRWYLRRSFLAYGLWPKRVINGDLNTQVLRAHQCTASKNPALFGIDLHVDDSAGVRQEGLRYGFETFIIEPGDLQWASRVLELVDRPGKPRTIPGDNGRAAR